MFKSFAIAIAAASLLTVPALAANSNSDNSSPNSSSSNTQNAQQAEQTLRQDLSKAGYTDIKIVPGSFLVHAKDSKGEPTEMMVTPNSVTAITAMNTSGNSSQGGTNSSSTASK